MTSSNSLRSQIAELAPKLWGGLGELATSWLQPVISLLDNFKTKQGFPKTINDPIWGVVELLPWETMLLDSLLLQRLRGVRQLGFAHYVYPGANHDRLEHSIGVVQAAQFMIDALDRNADHRRKFGNSPDETIPMPSDMDRFSTRLAALLHDIGHGPFSHMSEPIFRARFSLEFKAAEGFLRRNFEGVTQISTSETIAVILVLSEAMRKVLEHPNFSAPRPASDLAPAIAARMMGSRSYLTATYLSGVISGPLDADKLDYMARDSHHAGFPLGLDIKRLISKLEVVTVTTENAPNTDLRERARQSSNQRFYEIGISLAGLGAYEQMIISRVILYDRIYYHHKVRATESMARQLITVAEKEGGRQFTLLELFQAISDDSMVRFLSGELKSTGEPLAKLRAKAIGQDLLGRRIYHRAFAFAARFIAGLEGLPRNEQNDTRAYLWAPVINTLGNIEDCEILAEEIYKKAINIIKCVPPLSETFKGFSPEHVIVDLAGNKVTVRGNDILAIAESGNVAIPNLFFDSEKWTQAYEQQKRCGFVFAPREYVPLVALASKIIFYDKFNIVMQPVADYVSKTVGVIESSWLDKMAEEGACSKQCLEALNRPKPSLARLNRDELRLPDQWKLEDPELTERLSKGICEAIPAGLPTSILKSLIDGIENVVTFVDMIEKGGKYVGIESLTEKKFQEDLRDHLRSRSVEVKEGLEIGGGETDLVLPGSLIIENKVRHDRTTDPLASGPHYSYQARRYSIAVCTNIYFVVVAYLPSNESVILPMTKRILVAPVSNGPEGFAQIRVAIPWGQPKPSEAKSGKNYIK